MDATPAVLVWDRGGLEAECERAAFVREGVETYLGRAVFADSGSRIVRVRLSRVDEQGKRHVVARVSQEDEAGHGFGERSVTGDESCASLDEQLTLVVALLVDTPTPAEPTETPVAPPPEPEPPPSQASESSTEIVTAPSLQQPPPSPAHFALLAFGAGSAGATPALALGGGLLVSFKPRGFWGLGVEATALGPSSESLEPGRLDVSLVQAAASLCPLQSTDETVWWSACLSIGGARLRARSRGLLDARSDTQWFALPGLSVRAARIVGRRWLVGGGLVAAVPVSPDRYVYRDAEGSRQAAFQLSPLVLTLQVGLGWLVH
jgi:hypothetical protein